MNGKMVIFDIDGTIADSWSCMEYCYRKTFEAFGRTDITEDEFVSGFVGDLHSNLSRMLNIEGDNLAKAIMIFRRTYEGPGHTKSRPFDNIMEVIRQLHSEGYVLGVASMVYEPYAIDTFEAWGIKNLFVMICGSEMSGRRTKADMIRMCLDTAGISAEDAVMIGDGFNDESAARRTGVGFIAATYGYGITKENCLEYGYEFAESPISIPDAVRKHFERDLNP